MPKKIINKKSVSKKSSKKEASAKKIIDAPESSFFWVCDGKVLKNLYDLSMALEEISEEVYGYHANLERNDFSNWVKEILKEDKLASSLRRAKSRADASNLVKRRLRS